MKNKPKKRKEKNKPHTTKETDLCNFIIKEIKRKIKFLKKRFCCFFSFDVLKKRMIERESEREKIETESKSKKKSFVYL